MKNEEDKWVIDDATYVIKFFRNFYSYDSSRYRLFDLTDWFLILSSEDVRSLSLDISKEGFKKLFSKWSL